MGLKQQIVHGLGWNVGGSLTTQIVSFVTKIILARILFPEDFGLFAMAIILIQCMGLFVGFGLSSAVIYRKDEPQKTMSTALFLAVCTGVVLTGISIIGSSYIAGFFHQPQLASMIQWMSIVLIFDSISTILYAGLVKELHFKRKAYVDISAIIVYSVVVLFLATNGFGTWSLIIAYIIQHVLQAMTLWILSPIKPQLRFYKEIAKDIGHFGKYSLATLLFAWAITSIDNAFVGRKLGDEALGYYSFGFNIATLPVLSLTHMITGVFHPVFAKVHENKEKLREAYLKPLEWSLLVILPISTGLFLLADIVVVVVLGQRWVSMIPLLKIFAVYSIFRTVCTIISHLLEGIGKPKTACVLLAIEFCLLAIIFFPLITAYGIIGVAYAVIIARGISMVLHLLQIRSVLGISFGLYKKLLIKKLAATAIMGCIVFLSYAILQEKTLLNLIVLVFLGIVTYIAALFILEKDLFIEVKQILRNISISDE